MKTDEELWQICLDIYNQLYEEATPSADFDELKEGKFSKDSDYDDPYRDYYLDEEKQREIIGKHCEKHDLGEMEENQVSTEIHLGASPVGTKDAWRGEEE